MMEGIQSIIPVEMHYDYEEGRWEATVVTEEDGMLVMTHSGEPDDEDMLYMMTYFLERRPLHGIRYPNEESEQ